jgi:CRP-like cAMP-binding protein
MADVDTLSVSTAPQRLRLATARLPDCADVARFHLGRHFLEEVHLLSDRHQLDPAMVLIAQTVAVGTIERGMPRPGARQQGKPGVRPMSRRAIALATGLPRETVRRRLRRLVDLGLLKESPGGISCADDFLSDDHEPGLADMLARHVALTNILIAEGLIEPDMGGCRSTLQS